MAKIGNEQKKVWAQIAADFEIKNRQITVQYLGMDKDHYETSGLISMLLYENPDIYFEWGGERVALRMKEGHASDLTEELNKGDWKKRFLKGSWDGLLVSGKVFMIPFSNQVSSVIWYNKTIFQKYGITPPANWDQFEIVCEKLKKSGIIPLYMGNKDLWPAGNIMGHLVSRIVGEREYKKALKLKRKFNRPDFIEAFRYIQSFWNKGYINKDVNGNTSDEGTINWIKGKGAMHALGSWVVEIIQDESSKEFEYDFFNLPAIPGKKGDQTSILGLNIGFIINAKTKHFDESVKFLRYITSPEIAGLFNTEGDLISIKGSSPKNVHPMTHKITQFTNTTSTIVAPPDTDFDLKTSDAFYIAVSKVLGGVSTPEEALEELDQKLQIEE